jgi:hypothetical protein
VNIFGIKKINLVLIAAFIFPLNIFSQQESDILTEKIDNQKKVEFSGYGAFEGGQIVKGHYVKLTAAPEIEHIWLGHVYAGISVLGTLNKHFSALVTIESRLWYTTPLQMQRDYSTWGAPAQNYDVTIPNAVGMLKFGDTNDLAFNIKVGRFEYKYNPQAMDLGEYLFRTGCYPAYIQTNFDLPLARITGISIANILFSKFKHELLLTTMKDVRPFYDFTLTYLANLSFHPSYDISAGIQFDHLISVDENETSPKTNYFSYGYQKSPGDTAYYTFKGTKLMLRFSFDPKRFFNTSIFGEKDGIFYAEAAILGLKNYPRSNIYDSTNICNIYGYDDIFQKMPIMFGINIPTFKFFDVLCIEGEWFGSRYPDSYGPNFNITPAPATIPADGSPDDYIRRDDWKWAIYAKKTLFGGLSIIGLMARDHLRTEIYIKKDQDFETTLIKNNHWYWMLKIKYQF